MSANEFMTCNVQLFSKYHMYLFLITALFSTDHDAGTHACISNVHNVNQPHQAPQFIFISTDRVVEVDVLRLPPASEEDEDGGSL